MTSYSYYVIQRKDLDSVLDQPSPYMVFIVKWRVTAWLGTRLVGWLNDR